jgi:hypothetical protein
MLDVVLLAKALLIGALTSAAVLRLAAWGTPRPWRQSAAWSWAIGAGVLAASGATDQWPRWPALEDRARFLTLLVPLTWAVETLATIVRPGAVRWIVRVGLAAFVAPILLHNSVYLADLNGHDSAEWSPAQAAIVLCGLAAVQALVWASLSGLQSRTSTSAVLWVLMLDALAAAVTVMLAGYFRGGLLGLGLAGAIVGATLASYTVPPQSPSRGSLGMSVIGIFAVVLVGRFFGALSTGLATCLVFAPLLAWIVELPRLHALAAGWRRAARLTFVGVPLIVVVIVAQQRFKAASAARSRPPEPSATGERSEK